MSRFNRPHPQHCVLSSTEDSGPAPALRFFSAHQRGKKKDCFELPCSGGGCSFSWLFTLFVPNQSRPSQGHCRFCPSLGMDMAPRQRWDQRYRFRPSVCGLSLPSSKCALLTLFFPSQTLGIFLFPSIRSRPIPIPSQGLLCPLWLSFPYRWYTLRTHRYLNGLPGLWALLTCLHSHGLCFSHKILASSSYGQPPRILPDIDFPVQLVWNP